MLQQIIKDMYIEPELLLELSDEQKQILFLKMREEQVRRWKEKDEEYEREEKRKPKKPRKPGSKKVEFLRGDDGNEWVWVMGDHANDKTIEQIMEEEAQRKAIEQAEKEAEELRKREEEEIKRKIEEEKRRLEEEREKERKRLEEEALYQSIKEARLLAQKAEEERKKREEEEQKRLKELQEEAAVERRRSYTKINEKQKRRSNEIYIKWKEMRRQLDRVAEEASQEVDKNWREQEKKAKEAEQEMKLIAQRAREENRHSLDRAAQLIMNANRFTQGTKPPLPPKTSAVMDKNRELREQRRKSRPPRPPNREAVINWFHEEEKSRKTVTDSTTGKPAIWFHGVISRFDAEKLLLEKPLGTYLVRVSEKVWGYTISYRAKDRCKHFLIDASEEQYHFFGPNQLDHNSIIDLVNYHKEKPITVIGGEKLLHPCGQVSDPPDFWELFQNRRTESTSL
ncbi:SH2 domain-containing protein 4B-like [Ruditapes philippinarum]|uniref:SH2 domain-containing protein 4B-like n=1 Tax=Ruditapes philippinarum TaxID=129788 RepID=UPI00295A5863|nr:SH2 domain-containing protein 4B-like [Ruditapes philippinarum]